MSENSNKYIWRCARCSNHFTTIFKTEGMIKQEKKCSKCKSINLLTLTSKEIFIHCKCYDPNTNGYQHEMEETFPYPI
ncbi:MAG: hypothetical protein KKA31_03195 [Candidatus Margulisbacteria bacterium]|nr:hypothetical protein [Candidatus Margulisiibacteriota bacterium]